MDPKTALNGEGTMVILEEAKPCIDDYFWPL